MFCTLHFQAPHFRMRIFWLLGEIFRPEYDKIFGTVRQILKADELFQEFLRMYTVSTLIVYVFVDIIWHTYYKQSQYYVIFNFS